jgi:hypothetical protein
VAQVVGFLVLQWTLTMPLFSYLGVGVKTMMDSSQLLVPL